MLIDSRVYYHRGVSDLRALTVGTGQCYRLRLLAALSSDFVSYRFQYKRHNRIDFRLGVTSRDKPM